MARFNHAISLSLKLDSDNEEPTGKEVLKALRAKMRQLKESDVLKHIEIFDTEIASSSIILGQSIDVKPFRELMAKNDLSILNEYENKLGFIFEVLTDDETLEELLIETRLDWAFK